MSSITPNPNPETTMINHPSTSNPPPKQTANPNWLELPEDVWFMILSNLTTIDIIEKAQLVCTLFRKICKQPAMFNIIDMYLPHVYMEFPDEVNLITRSAVDRSAGGLVDITLEIHCHDHTLMYIVDRSKYLKRLVLVYCVFISDECLIEAVKKLPMLEELQLIICSLPDETVEAIGRACPSLKSFSLNEEGPPKRVEVDKYGNDDALAIAISMPQLRHLQLIGNYMSDKGLKAILDGCPLLESLDLRDSRELNISEDSSKRCEKIKLVRYPNDSTYDYPWQGYLHGAYDDRMGQAQIDKGSDSD